MESSSAADLKRRFDDLLNHLPAGVVVHGVDGRILHANRLACELVGLRLDQLGTIDAGSKAWHYLSAEDGSVLPPDQFPVNVVLRTGSPLPQTILGTPGGPGSTVRWLICNAYPEFDCNGLLCRVVVCFTDCTALKEAQQSLQKSEERLRLVLQGSTDAPWDFDLVNNEIYYSDRWWNMLGYQPGELGQDTGLWLTLTHPDDKQRILDTWQELLRGESATFSTEWRLHHRLGHYVPVLSRGLITRDAEGKAVRVSGTNTDLTERKLTERRIYKLAYYDHLTGLPNRRLLAEELEKALARSQRSRRLGAVIFLDLDNFKLLNDTMGHDFGDMLLRQVADRLRHNLRHCDQLARLGGDEFVLVLEDLGDDVHEAVIEANHVLEKLLSSLGQPYYLKNRLFMSTPSMGVTVFDGISHDIETLLKQADLAMYRAKADGRNTARFFDPAMQASAEHQAALEHALREGLSRHQFVLYCQPQFCAQGRLVGAEALVRWRRADGRLLGPDEFIGLAESSGLIAPLGQYVLEESCRALARWRGDHKLSTLKLAVNISAHQLRDADFSATVAKILKHTGAPASKLCLELTESIFAENTAEIVKRMHELTGRGIHLSLDDFGTGYSSLAYLRRFPLTALKIDRSFVHDVHLDPEAAPIVRAIIALARTLKLDIVAEGVEHEAQRRFLIEGGCGALQGYLLGRPLPISDFERIYSSAGIGHA